ncbi:hypothetical protein GRF59_21675 [Paenibacillus sp. HJL G12]|uniref:SLH domain-containing protein n=1 Tax=Paenibacillus dendrobii TaxID=2691084 RepID=A0A7X3LJG0_9BACL|nr:hypothetical protein [Paenibacillus dendrobii]
MVKQKSTLFCRKFRQIAGGETRLYKRIINLSLLICMLVSLVSPGFAAAERSADAPAAVLEQGSPNSSSAPINSFQDVKPTDWFYDAVTYVKQNGIFGGTDNDSFSPKGTMTRAMYVTALGRMAGVDISQYSISSFSDVQAGTWYAPYVQWAIEKGITSGTGDHDFSPNAAISREQMATLALRYFESYKIPYQTNASLTSKPNDTVDISPWAVDAVVKLWQAGLLHGDAIGNFNPKSNASRAEASVFFMRNNEVVKTWITQNRVVPTPTPTPTSPTLTTSTPTSTPDSGSGNGANPGDTNAGPYIITFETNGGSAINSLSLKQGATLNHLPDPMKSGSIFVGWYKDSALSEPVYPDAIVNRNMTLYARYEEPFETQTIPSVTKLDQDKSFTIGVIDGTGSMTADSVKAGMTFEALTHPDFATHVGIRVEGSSGEFTVGANSGAFEEGGTYQLKLNNANLSFAGQDKSTTTYVFTIAKQEVQHVTLNPDLIYIPSSEVTNMTQNGKVVTPGTIPVIDLNAGDGGAVQSVGNATEGIFQYHGNQNIQVGNTVAIYNGVAPNQRNLATSADDDGEVAYVTIRAIDGSTYTYETADAKKVLFTPDVLPVSDTADMDGDLSNHSITVSENTMNYSDSKYAQLGLTASTVVQAGDFIAFYTGVFGDASSQLAGYAQITGVSSSGTNDVITYTDVTLEQITASMDYYTQQNVEGSQLLQNTDVAVMEAQIEDQALESGFVNKATQYLAALAIDTDSFKKLDGDFDMKNYSITYADGSSVSDRNVMRLNGNRVQVENVSVKADIGTELQHFADKSGLSASLQVSCDIVVDAGGQRNIVIHLTGTFEQEVRVSLSADANTDWGLFLGFIPYLREYEVSPTVDTYTYTAINFDAEIGTFEKGEEWNWNDNSKVQNIAKQIKALMDAKEDLDEHFNGIDSLDSSLPALYQNMLNNETDWVDLFDVNLVDINMRLLLGIIQVEFKGDFVVSANANLSIGCTFSYENGKRYIFNVKLFAREATNKTVSLLDEKYQFTFYTMGTLGLRAGLRLELAVGLFSTEANSVGVQADVGAYVKLWGYFYYQLTYLSSQGKTSHYAGAIDLEFGVFTEVKFKAQLFKGTFSYEPTLYEDEWPLYTVGSRQNILDFAYSQDDAPRVNLHGQSTKSTILPYSIFDMSSMDLQTGEVTEQSYDRSKDFTVSISNKNFIYDTRTNQVLLQNYNYDPTGMDATMTITWRRAPLTFGSAPIARTIPLHWDDLKGSYSLYLYSHETNDGKLTLLKTISGKYNDPIPAEPVPTRKGYKFVNWYKNDSDAGPTALPGRMPSYDSMWVARWTPKTDTPYKVEVYLQNVSNDSYTLSDEFTYKGTTDWPAAARPPAYAGFATPAEQFTTVKGDGSTVVKYYYARNVYKLTFDPGHGGTPITSSLKFGAPITAPIVNMPGYVFTSWRDTNLSENVPASANVVAPTMPAINTTYKGIYSLDSHVPITVEYYLGDNTGSNFQLMEAKTKYGTAFLRFDNRDIGTMDARWMSPYSKLTTTVPSPLSIYVDPTLDLRIKLYFVPYLFNLTFDANGGVGGTVSQLAYGSPINPPTVTKPGYTFEGWSQSVPSTMPGNDLTFTAVWQATGYQVLYYQQNLDDDGYTEVEAVAGSGGIGSTATATPKDYTGFTYDSSNPNNVTSGTVTADGTLTLKLYYTRNSYTLLFIDSVTSTNYSTAQVKYGATIVPPADVIPSDFYPPGFVLITWDPLENDTPSLEAPEGATMPAHDASYNARFGFPGGQLGL